jgi:hypothetical protein
MKRDLAWNTKPYGAIPEKENLKLRTAGHGIHQNAETDRLLMLAQDVRPFARNCGLGT